MQKKNLLKTLGVVLVAISFSCGSSETETKVTSDSLTVKSRIMTAPPPGGDSTGKDTGDRTTPRVQPPPPPPPTQ